MTDSENTGRDIGFDEYIRQAEPGKNERASLWRTAIGLQDVDGLRTSEYLVSTARKHIEGEIDIDEVRGLIDSYYQSKVGRESANLTLEADKVSANITKILSSQTLDFSTEGFLSVHRRVFEGVFEDAGKFRDHNISKQEWVLDGDSVNYLNWEDLRRAIDYDIAQERMFSYKGLSSDSMIDHISGFVSGLWQIHPFGEGNTRATAVFAILYLRSLGFKVNNDLFAHYSWYFRNALVRANYKNAVQGVDYNPVYLERFFRNLLLGEKWDLRNRYLHIHATGKWSEQPILEDPAPQVPHKYPTSTPQAGCRSQTVSQYVCKLIQVVGNQAMSSKEILSALGLKERKNFLNLYLKPAVAEGYVLMLYPDSPHHPRQKYSLTDKGLELYGKVWN